MNRLFLCLLFISLFACDASADPILTFQVDVVEDAIQIGDAVNWNVFVTVSNSDAGNFGIASVSTTLTDSLGESIVPGTNPMTEFIPYFKNAGTTDPGTGKLVEITAVLFTQNVLAEGIDPSNDLLVGGLGPILLASGSYTPTLEGTHELSAEAGSSNLFFIMAGGTNGAVDGTRGYQSVGFVSDSFSVSAVPEPSILSVLSLTGMFFVAHNRRRSRLLPQVS